jgi:hypothetical protein
VREKMSENNTSRTMAAELMNELKTLVQLAVSILWLASIVVWFSNEDP